MAIGIGNYDDLCTYVRKEAKANGVALIVFGGTKGGGFSVQGKKEIIQLLPEFLRYMADEIDKDLKEDQSPLR